MPISALQYAEMLARTNAVQRVNQAIVSSALERESDLHDQIIDFCKNRSWFYVHSRMDRPTTTACGVVDFIIARDDGKTLWVECKKRGGKLTPHQQGVVHWLERNKQIVAVVYSLEDFIAVAKMEVPYLTREQFREIMP